MSFMHATVACQCAALVFHAGTTEVWLGIDEWFVRESSLPG
jgi:hypothetical protein